MTFDDWWNEQDYPASCKGNCEKAFEARNNELVEKDIIINFLKKELIHKTAYKNVMKRQYLELRKKYDAVKPRVDIQIDFKLHKFAYFDIIEWSQEEAEELVAKWKEIEKKVKKSKKENNE